MRHLLGFTLLEMLVVMAIVGLLAGFVAPGFAKLSERTSHSVARNGVLAGLDGLAYRVYLDGRPLELNAQTAALPLQDGMPALALPEGWSIDVTTAPVYNASGVCSGGEIGLIDPDGLREQLKLAPPACHLAGQDA